MIEHSKEWARNRGLLWKNEVHGEDEWRIPLRRSFTATSTTGTETKEKASAVVQDRDVYMQLAKRRTQLAPFCSLPVMPKHLCGWSQTLL